VEANRAHTKKQGWKRFVYLIFRCPLFASLVEGSKKAHIPVQHEDDERVFERGLLLLGSGGGADNLHEREQQQDKEAAPPAA